MRSNRRQVVSAISGACALLLLLVPAAARGEELVCLLLDPGFDRSRCTSTICLSCHDGSAARLILRSGSHAVDVSYAAAWLDRRFDLSGSPPRELVLSAGRVTCATCHDGRSREPHRIALPADALCTGCHVR